MIPGGAVISALFRSLSVAAAAIACLSSPALTQVDTAPATDTIDYAAQAAEVIRDAYAIFAGHHPGMYKPLDPEFA